jgi:poly-gamma-glutamate capsule biosynthesis protein CapA/YwtB (metallophosphatase superfamily)
VIKKNGGLESRRDFMKLIACGIGTAATRLLPSTLSAQQNIAQKPSVYEDANGDITMALGGDAELSRALMPFREPGFLKVREVLQSADVRFANAETLFHNYEDWPTASTYYTRTYMRCDPRFIKDLQWLGINMISCANNHTTDFGQEGVLTNIRNLEDAGMVHAGSGCNDAAALAPAYLDTPKGRVALIAATSTSRLDARAGDQGRDMKGRPGVNIVRWINEWTVDKEAYDALGRVAKQFGWNKQNNDANRIFFRDYGITGGDNAVYFADRNALVIEEDSGARFILGDKFEHRSRLNEADLARNVQSVKDARRMAEWVIYSIHSHEGGTSMLISEEAPSDHTRALAYRVLDEGADVFICHGAHKMRGIEIYQDKPIFYSPGNLLIEDDTVLLEPQDAMEVQGLGPEKTAADSYDERTTSGQHTNTGPAWHAFIPVVSFRSNKLHEIKIYPIELGAGLPRYEAGRPMLAQGKLATEILQQVQKLSDPFHTKLQIQGDIGIIQVG